MPWLLNGPTPVTNLLGIKSISTLSHKLRASSEIPYEINKKLYVHVTALGVEILALMIKISTIFNQ